jgi:hypothetical protein
MNIQSINTSTFSISGASGSISKRYRKSDLKMYYFNSKDTLVLEFYETAKEPAINIPLSGLTVTSSLTVYGTPALALAALDTVFLKANTSTSGSGTVVSSAGLTFDLVSEPASPPSGKAVTWWDGNNLMVKESDGTVHSIGDDSVDLPLISDSSQLDFDFSVGDRQHVNLSSSVGSSRGILITGVSAGHIGVLEVKHVSAGTTIDLPSPLHLKDKNFEWATGANEETLLNFFYNGTNFKWSSTSYSSLARRQLVIRTSNVPFTITSGDYTPTTVTSNWGNHILWDKKLAAGTDGWIEMELNNPSVIGGMIGFLETSAEGGYPDMKVGFWHGGGGFNVMENGGVISPAGDLLISGVWGANEGARVGIHRNGSTWTIKRSLDNAATWQVIYTFLNYHGVGDMFPISDVNIHVTDPIEYNLIAY